MDVSGDGFYIINIASFDRQGTIIDDLQVLFINGIRYFKCQPSFDPKGSSIAVTTPNDCGYDVVILTESKGKIHKKQL